MSDDTEDDQNERARAILHDPELLLRLAEQIIHAVWARPGAHRNEIRIVRPATKRADLVPNGHAELLAGAHACAARGWRVFPLVPALVDDELISEDYKLAKRTGKHPAMKGWPQLASTDPATIDAWWAARRVANIGIVTGAASDLTVVDVDVKTAEDGTVIDGRIAILRLEHLHGDLPIGPRVRRGLGRHLYFRHVQALKNSVGILPGIDIRSEGGFVVAPPSFHRNGSRYHFAQDSLTTPVPDMPTWLVDELLAAATTTTSGKATRRPRPAASVVAPPEALPAAADAYAAAALAAEVAAVANAAEGARNHTLNRAAFALGQLVGARVLDRDEVSDALADAARVCGLPDHEIEQTIEHALDDGELQPRDLSQIGVAAPDIVAIGTEEVR